MPCPCKQIDISKHTRHLSCFCELLSNRVGGRAFLSRNIISKFLSRSVLLLLWGFHRLPRKQLSCCHCYSNICIVFSSIFRSSLFVSQFTEFQMHSVVSRCWICVCWSELNEPWRHTERGSWTTLFISLIATISSMDWYPSPRSSTQPCIDQLNFLCFCQERQIYDIREQICDFRSLMSRRQRVF